MPLLQSLPESLTIAPGVNLLVYPDNRFKRCLMQIHMDRPLDELSSARTLWAQVVAQGTADWPSRLDLARRSEHLFGAGFHLAGHRLADGHRMTLELDWIAERFLPKGTLLQEDVLDLGRSLLTRPLRGEESFFRSDIFERELLQLKRQIRAMEDDRDAYARERFLHQICRGEPMGKSPWGTLEEIENLDIVAIEGARKDVLQFSSITIVAVGPLRVESLIDSLAEIYSDDSSVRESLPEPIRSNPSNLREFKDYLPVDQAKFHMGFRFIPPSDVSGMEEIGLANLILGGGIHGRLFRIIREQRSLAYSIGSHLRSLKGILSVSAGINSSAYEEVRDEVLAQVGDLANGGAEDHEIDMAKAAIRDSLESLADSPASIASYIAREHLLGMRRAPLDRFNRLDRIGNSEIATSAALWSPDLVYLLSEK